MSGLYRGDWEMERCDGGRDSTNIRNLVAASLALRTHRIRNAPNDANDICPLQLRLQTTYTLPTESNAPLGLEA